MNKYKYIQTGKVDSEKDENYYVILETAAITKKMFDNLVVIDHLRFVNNTETEEIEEKIGDQVCMTKKRFSHAQTIVPTPIKLKGTRKEIIDSITNTLNEYFDNYDLIRNSN